MHPLAIAEGSCVNQLRSFAEPRPCSLAVLCQSPCTKVSSNSERRGFGAYLNNLLALRMAPPCLSGGRDEVGRGALVVVLLLLLLLLLCLPWPLVIHCAIPSDVGWSFTILVRCSSGSRVAAAARALGGFVAARSWTLPIQAVVLPFPV